MRTPGLAQLEMNPHPALHQDEGSENRLLPISRSVSPRKGSLNAEWMNKEMKENRKRKQKTREDVTEEQKEQRKQKEREETQRNTLFFCFVLFFVFRNTLFNVQSSPLN